MQTTRNYAPEVEYLKALIDGFEKALSKKTQKELYDKFVITTRLNNRRLITKPIFIRDFLRPLIALQLLDSEKACYFEDLKMTDINYLLQLTSHQTAKDVENNVFRFLRHPKNQKNFRNVYDTLNILLQEV